jgi:hypothetical protein
MRFVLTAQHPDQLSESLSRARGLIAVRSGSAQWDCDPRFKAQEHTGNRPLGIGAALPGNHKTDHAFGGIVSATGSKLRSQLRWCASI